MGEMVQGKFEDADDMTVLVTGGLGYIGSHTCVSLLQSGRDVVILDNLSNSVPRVAQRIEAIAGRKPVFVQGDMLDGSLLDRLFAEYRIDSVIHFAGYKAVGESVAEPLKYYRNNLTGTLCLLESMSKAGVKTLVFSSSATVYGDPASLPIREDFPLSATNPYGRSKLIQEEIFNDLAASDPEWKIVNLRYFNPVGAHESGLIGEDPRDIPNNLMPYLLQVAIGRLPELRVFGGDYPTPDGTGVRDYIHVVDLAEGHLAALKYLETARGCVAVILEPAAVSRCSSCARRSSARPTTRCPAGSSTAGRAMSPHAGPIPRWPGRCSAGRRSASCNRCAATPGIGKPRILKAIPID